MPAGDGRGLFAGYKRDVIKQTWACPSVRELLYRCWESTGSTAHNGPLSPSSRGLPALAANTIDDTAPDPPRGSLLDARKAHVLWFWSFDASKPG